VLELRAPLFLGFYFDWLFFHGVLSSWLVFVYLLFARNYGFMLLLGMCIRWALWLFLIRGRHISICCCNYCSTLLFLRAFGWQRCSYHTYYALPNLEPSNRFQRIEAVVLSDGLHFFEKHKNIPDAKLTIRARSQQKVLLFKLYDRKALDPTITRLEFYAVLKSTNRPDAHYPRLAPYN